MRNTKGAFTLVELIVVITILAILGTIAFISLQGYSAEARNSKRIQDLSSVSSALNIKLTNGMSVLSAVGDNTNSTGAIALAGTGATAFADTVYKAGSVNYTALEMKGTEFSDPSSDEAYRIGATTLAGNPFQLAASIESDAGTIALINGSYNPRDPANQTGSVTGTGSKSVTIDLTDTGKFKRGDYTNYGKISKVSSDGQTITLESLLINTTGTIQLSNEESDGLIWGSDFAKTNPATGFVTNNKTILPY